MLKRSNTRKFLLYYLLLVWFLAETGCFVSDFKTATTKISLKIPEIRFMFIYMLKC